MTEKELADLAHNVNNPLAILLGNITLLDKKDLNKELLIKQIWRIANYVKELKEKSNGNTKTDSKNPRIKSTG